MLASAVPCQTRDKGSGMEVCSDPLLPPTSAAPHPSTPPPDPLINILVGLQMASLGQGRTPSGSLSYSPHFSPLSSVVLSFYLHFPPSVLHLPSVSFHLLHSSLLLFSLSLPLSCLPSLFPLIGLFLALCPLSA